MYKLHKDQDTWQRDEMALIRGTPHNDSHTDSRKTWHLSMCPRRGFVRQTGWLTVRCNVTWKSASTDYYRLTAHLYAHNLHFLSFVNILYCKLFYVKGTGKFSTTVVWDTHPISRRLDGTVTQDSVGYTKYKTAGFSYRNDCSTLRVEFEESQMHDVFTKCCKQTLKKEGRNKETTAERHCDCIL
jgi:hypothetical protein